MIHGTAGNPPKDIETRSWKTRYRGPFLIVASKAVETDIVEDMRAAGVQMPRRFDTGCAVAVTTIVDCRPMTNGDVHRAYCPLFHGAWAFVLEGTRAIQPFPVRGQLGFYKVDAPMLRFLDSGVMTT